MQWEKAKTIIIVFMLGLNMMLGGFLFARDRQYELSSEQAQAITNLLAGNNIILYCSIDKNYAPMRRVELQNMDFEEYDSIVDLFFKDSSGLNQVSRDGRIEYINGRDDESLTVSPSEFFYYYSGEGEAFDLNPAAARELSQRFINKLGDMGKGFTEDVEPYYEDNMIKVVYKQEHKGYKLYDNSLAFHIDGGGIRRIWMTYYTPIGFEDNSRELCSPDEALYTFMRFVTDRISRQSSFIVDRIEIVYKLFDDTDNYLYAVPCYRIYFIYDNEEGVSVRQDCIIDGYMNVVI